MIKSLLTASFPSFSSFPATIFFGKAVKLRPQEARAHTNLGAILHLLGRTQEAANSYREALRLQPDDLTTLSNLAKLGVPAIS